ncbi:MAG TPA: biopolymer transporter ExbD [Bryobacteraceae bacterium]|jgi:biopolymer transport protein ExbD|nr:biopolymer transporter ExbD [Bryobacteraceae bacterium]
MAFSTGGSSGSIGGRRRYSGTLAEINIVPLVDVVLVLLIIFMVTASVMEFGLEVDVPAVDTTRDSAEELPVVTITRDSKIFLGDKATNIHDLAPEIRKRFKNAKAVYLSADKETIYDPIAQVVAELGEKAKFNVRLVTKTRDSAPKRK